MNLGGLDAAPLPAVCCLRYSVATSWRCLDRNAGTAGSEQTGLQQWKENEVQCKLVNLLMIGAALLASAATSAVEPDAAGALFSRVETAEGQHHLEGVDWRPVPLRTEARQPGPRSESPIRSRAVRVDLGRLNRIRDLAASGDAAPLTLNLFNDVELEAVIERTATTRFGYSLSGRIKGQTHGSVTFVVSDDIVAGAVFSPQGNFVVASRSGAVHRVVEIAGGLECEVEGPEHWAPPTGVSPDASAANVSDGDDGATIDLLVLYTEAALAVEGGLRPMRASIDLAVAWTNDAYEASGVNTRLNLAAAVQVDYQEERSYGLSGFLNQNLDLHRLVEPTDGVMDEVHELRDRYAADVVYLVVDSPGGGGKARLLQARDEDPSRWAFALSKSLSYPNPFFLAHELGHVMGLLHERYQNAEDSPQYFESDSPFPPYSYGYVNQRAFQAGAPVNARWRTIMAYGTQCYDEGFYCRWLQRFSNPNQRYPDDAGDPLGVPGDEPTDAVDGPADAARTLNENRLLVAGFRDSATRCDYRMPEERREVSASEGAFSFEIEADSSCPWTATAFSDFLEIESGGSGTGAGRVSYRVEANDGPGRVGYIVVAGETLSVYQSGQTAPANVCARTAPIRDAITAATGRDCAAISEFDLLDVTTLNLRSRGITTLDAGDFTGLTYLNELNLSANPLDSIPEEAFEDLVNLKSLILGNSGLDSVPTAIRGLPALQELESCCNAIESLHSDAFQGLSELRDLHLQDNRLSTLPDGVLSDLKRLEYLDLRRNEITDVRKEALQGPKEFGRLDLSENPIGDLREDAFASVPGIRQLFLRATELRAVPPRLFEGKRILDLDLSRNRIQDVSGLVFPGDTVSGLNLADNALQEIPAGVFGGFTSPSCRSRQLDLNLSGNPGAPFPLSFELDRVDAADSAAGPAKIVVRVREGAPWPITVRIASASDSSFTTEATVFNGHTESEPFDVESDDPTQLRFAAAPRVPGSYRGIRIALGGPLQLFSLDDRELGLGAGQLEIDLDDAIAKEGIAYTYDAESSDHTVATVSVANGLLLVDAHEAGKITVTVTATAEDGTETVRSFDLRIVSRVTKVPYMPPSIDLRRQGFVRVINHSTRAGMVTVDVRDDKGVAYDSLTLSMPANGVKHFNSDDLEHGNDAKGLSGGVGQGHGGWRLAMASDLDIEALSYIRTTDGFLTAMHDVAPQENSVHRVAIFNPGSNTDQVSLLRLINPGEEDAAVTVRGIDGNGASPGSIVELSVPAGTVRTIGSADLESGNGVQGALGDGIGKWELEVSSDQAIRAMSLLESRSGHLTNLSTVPGVVGDTYAVPLFPSASDELGRQGFVRVINNGDMAAEVAVTAFDETDRDYDPLTLTVGASHTVHFNSDDLELGNQGKGLSGSTGAGTGDWWLTLRSQHDIDVLSYIRTRDGFLTSMHDVVPGVEGRHRAPTFNPGRNTSQVSTLRLVNAGDAAAKVTISAVDDAGSPSNDVVRASIPARAVRTYSAAELESGSASLEGALGRSTGKWQIFVESDRPIMVMSLLESPTGHLTNLSTGTGGR